MLSEQCASCSLLIVQVALHCAAWLSCDIDFCDSLEENHISFYWLESYINCVMENTVAASRKTHFEHGLILGWAVLSSRSTAEWRKAASFTSTCGEKMQFICFGYFKAFVNSISS